MVTSDTNLPTLPTSAEVGLPSPTGGDDDLVVWDFAWPAIMASATNVRVSRSNTAEWGDYDIIQCDLNGAPTVMAHCRKIDGKAREFGWAWHRSTLRTELQAITNKRHLAALAILFGDVFLDLMFDNTA